MKLETTRVLLTGAAGGIGSALAEQLAASGASLALLGRNDDETVPLADRLKADGAIACTVSADLLDREVREQAINEARQRLGGIDMLINCAGLMSFRPFSEEDPELMARIVQLNLTVPMMTARQVLPEMLKRGSGHIVNIGSTFGSIGFAWFAAYSASKFGLRGFSEALRRELDGTGVNLTYVAPRAVKTKLNTDAVYRMAEATRMNMDDPAWVAAKTLAAIEADAKDVYLGFPEKFFARLNSFLPRLVDGGLRKQNQVMGGFARDA